MRIIRTQLDLGLEVEEDINWEDVRSVGVDIDTIFEKLFLYSSDWNLLRTRYINKYNS